MGMRQAVMPQAVMPQAVMPQAVMQQAVMPRQWCCRRWCPGSDAAGGDDDWASYASATVDKCVAPRTSVLAGVSRMLERQFVNRSVKSGITTAPRWGTKGL
jgi:hypothetical protein